MLILRLFIVIVLLLLVVSGVVCLFTRDSRYLRFSWQVIRFSALLLAMFGLLYLLERYALVAWRVLI
jgi:cytochrome b subunit of formate dehydrogenase